ncbi:MAG: FkbM family methyltransferase [Thermodesulfobacteriota bacterium]
MIGPYGPFRLDARFAFSDFAHWGEGHNDGFRDCVGACRGKRCVIDIGAHIGLVTLAASSVMADDGLLAAFEPAEANRRLLLRHLELNGLQGKVRVESALVGDEEQQSVPFFELDDATGMNTIAPGVMDGKFRRVTRPQVSLDSYCASHGFRPEVIKIDVEGAELGVLRGARAVLERDRPLVFLSVHPQQIRSLGESPEELAELIRSLRYVCRHADGSPATDLAFHEYLLFPVEQTQRDETT